MQLCRLTADGLCMMHITFIVLSQQGLCLIQQWLQADVNKAVHGKAWLLAFLLQW